VGKHPAKRPAVFIDRDGTLIREKNYLSKIRDVRLIAGAVEALKLLRRAGYALIMVTNQSGIGRGYFTEEQLRKVHLHLSALLKKKGAALDAIYYCPHHPDEDCKCRKPGLGMVNAAKKEFNLDLRRSYAVGDHTNDFLLGQNMGGKGIFVLTGHGRRERKKIESSKGELSPDKTFRNLFAAAKWIARQ